MMKRIFLFGVFFAFIRCTDDVTHENVERQNPHNNPEISPDGLKLKWVNGFFFRNIFIIPTALWIQYIRLTAEEVT